MSAIEGVVAYQGWSLRGVPLYTRPKKHFKNEQRSKDAAAKKDLIQVE